MGSVQCKVHPVWGAVHHGGDTDVCPTTRPTSDTCLHTPPAHDITLPPHPASTHRTRHHPVCTHHTTVEYLSPNHTTTTSPLALKRASHPIPRGASLFRRGDPVPSPKVSHPQRLTQSPRLKRLTQRVPRLKPKRLTQSPDQATTSNNKTQSPDHKEGPSTLPQPRLNEATLYHARPLASMRGPKGIIPSYLILASMRG